MYRSLTSFCSYWMNSLPYLALASACVLALAYAKTSTLDLLKAEVPHKLLYYSNARCNQGPKPQRSTYLIFESHQIEELVEDLVKSQSNEWEREVVDDQFSSSIGYQTKQLLQNNIERINATKFPNSKPHKGHFKSTVGRMFDVIPTKDTLQIQVYIFFFLDIQI